LAVFQSLARRTPTNQLSKHDENGLGLMHYAAIYNNPSIITALMLNGIDANIKQQVEYIAVGPMPVHYAARCGSLDALSCLTANYANVSFADHEGWTPVHHAAYFDNVPALRLLVRRQPELLELATRANDSTKRRHTPLLVSASAGALQALKCLIKFGANKLYVDEAGHNVLHVAALR
jgi:ankyrin repeat protein